MKKKTKSKAELLFECTFAHRTTIFSPMNQNRKANQRLVSVSRPCLSMYVVLFVFLLIFHPLFNTYYAYEYTWQNSKCMLLLCDYVCNYVCVILCLCMTVCVWGGGNYTAVDWWWDSKSSVEWLALVRFAGNPPYPNRSSGRDSLLE